MKYEVSFGRMGKSRLDIKPRGSDKFRIALLGDFSGRANKGELETGDALAKRKPLKIEFDTIDDVIARLGIELDIPVGADGASAHVAIGSIDDFHPDELYGKVEVFEGLSGLRQRLNNSKFFEAAAKEVQKWTGDKSLTRKVRPKKKSRGADMPVGKLSDFKRLMGRPAVETPGAHSVDDLLKRVVAPYVVAAPNPQQEAMVAAVDNALSGLMRSILHHPDFQALEAMWRGVDMMCRTLETDSQLQIVLFNVTAEEIAADLSSADDLTQTGLYKMLVEQPAMDAQQGPFAVVAGYYTFELTPPHAELLARIAQIVAMSNTAFIAAMGNDILKNLKPEDWHELVTQSWGALKGLPQARYLGLTVPRYMVRNPYGKKGEPIDPFEFEEFTSTDGLRSLLWGNSAILVATLLGLSFTEAGSIKGMKPGKIMSMGDMPFYYFTDEDGDQIALPCTDRMMPMKLVEQVTTLRFMPMLAIKGQPEVRLGSWASLGGGNLAGPWQPLGAPEPEPEPEAEPEAEAPADEEEASFGESTDSDDFSSMSDDDSGSSEVSDDSGGESGGEAGGDDDLDALLASLGDDSDSDSGGGDDDSGDSGGGGGDDEMDPELAALLADL